MEWNNCTYIEMLREWKQHRVDIVALPFEDAMKAVAKFWGTVPIHTSKNVRLYEPETWMSPWEILHENSLCENKVAIMIYHTLVAAYEDDDVDVTMRVAYDKGDEFLVVAVNRTYISGDACTLNYITGSPVMEDDQPSINFIHTFDEDTPHLREK